METLFMLGRILFGGFFVLQAYNHFKNQANMTHYARAKGLPVPSAAVFASGVLLLLGGLSLVLGFEMVIGMWLLVIFLIPTTFMMHTFWKEKDPQTRMVETIMFSKNVALIGALLMMIAMAFIFF
ncbi:MAG TPA: DoxX family membrane protein [Candidatus Paceibacterota bacterium]